MLLHLECSNCVTSFCVLSCCDVIDVVVCYACVYYTNNHHSVCILLLSTSTNSPVGHSQQLLQQKPYIYFFLSRFSFDPFVGRTFHLYLLVFTNQSNGT